jgi:hypothetical protein
MCQRDRRVMRKKVRMSENSRHRTIVTWVLLELADQVGK